MIFNSQREWLLFEADKSTGTDSVSKDDNTDDDVSTDSKTENNDVDTGSSQTVKTGDKSTDATKTFTQEQLDSIIKKRIAEERNKYSDYDDMKSTIENVNEQLNQLAKEKKEAEERALKVERETALNAAIDELKVDKKLTYKLFDFDSVKDDNYIEAVKLLLEEYPTIKTKVTNDDAEKDADSGNSDDTKKFSLYRQSNQTFWKGGGLRINEK